MNWRTVKAPPATATSLAPAALRAEFGAYLGEVERIVAAVDALGG
jgi:hypothetical protein